MESTIIANLLKNQEFAAKVAPYLRLEYFDSQQDSTLVQHLLSFYDKYHSTPSPDSLKLMIVNDGKLDDKQVESIQALVDELPEAEPNLDWLVSESEKFCRDRAIYNALLASVQIVDGRDSKHTKDAIPSILQKALAVGFDTRIGHDYLGAAQERFNFYHNTENKVSFGVGLLDKISRGGMSDKSLTIVLSGTGGGKTLTMCHVAASALRQGKNVLYVTMEMAEERIGERIDANLLNLTMDEMKVISNDSFMNKVSKLQEKTQGTLVIKEFPTASAHAGHIRALIEEIKLKRGIEFDLLIVDYLGICASERIRMSSGANSYTYIKSVAEELRGLGMEYGFPVLSASQVNRTGYQSSDPGLSDIADSFGIAATADMCFVLITDDAMDGKDQILVKQLKNRYADPSIYRKFMIGANKDKMRLFDLEASAQVGISDSGQPAVQPKIDTSFEGFKF